MSMWEEITKEEFEKYLRVQESGEYNMLDSAARARTGLPRNVYLEILRSYDKLSEKFKKGESSGP